MGQFARETAIEQVAENHYRGELCAGWRIGAVPNGGYVRGGHCARRCRTRIR